MRVFVSGILRYLVAVIVYTVIFSGILIGLERIGINVGIDGLFWPRIVAAALPFSLFAAIFSIRFHFTRQVRAAKFTLIFLFIFSNALLYFAYSFLMSIDNYDTSISLYPVRDNLYRLGEHDSIYWTREDRAILYRSNSRPHVAYERVPLSRHSLVDEPRSQPFTVLDFYRASQGIAKDIYVFNRYLIDLYSQHSAMNYFIAVIIFFLLNAFLVVEFIRITRWPAFNLVLTILIISGIFRVVRMSLNTTFIEFIREIVPEAPIEVFPVFILAIASLFFALITLIRFLSERSTTQS